MTFFMAIGSLVEKDITKLVEKYNKSKNVVDKGKKKKSNE